MAKKSAKKKPAKKAAKKTSSKKTSKSARSVAANAPHPEDHIDACAVDFTKGELTHDRDLPMAMGGVAKPARGGKRK